MAPDRAERCGGGVRVGDISEVSYDDGVAVVTMDIDQKYLPVYATRRSWRPKTGLRDMFLGSIPAPSPPGSTKRATRSPSPARPRT